jgi:hypothetical protein
MKPTHVVYDEQQVDAVRKKILSSFRQREEKNITYLLDYIDLLWSHQHCNHSLFDKI